MDRFEAARLQIILKAFPDVRLGVLLALVVRRGELATIEDKELVDRLVRLAEEHPCTEQYPSRFYGRMLHE